MSRKNVLKSIIIIMAAGCLALFIILNNLWNKIQYSVEKIDDKYIVSISNDQGEIIYKGAYALQPVISKTGESTFMVTVGKGDSRTTKFINKKTGIVSDGFENISACNEKIVIYGTYESDKLKIIIRDIYDKNKYYEEIIDTFPNVAVGSYIIKDAQIYSNGSIDLTYYVDDDWTEKKKVVFWDE